MKKKILFLSNFSLANTGFGKYQKNLLTRLYKTGKYELCELACGISDQDPNVTRVPWKVIGVLPRNQEEMYRFNSAPDEATRRAFAYGGFRFEEAIFSFKPDIVVCHEDIWAWAGWVKQLKCWGKFVPIAFHPLDAEPLAEEFAMFLKDFKHIYTYGKWSQEIGIKANLPQTKIATLGIDHNVFKPLERNYVKLLRTQFDIKDTDYVVTMVARNQVRKKFDALFESLNEMGRYDSDLSKNIKILPFSNYTDPAGFLFPKFWKSRGIDESKILTPYICKDCRGYHIAHKYEGEEKNCPLCKTQKSCHTPSVVDGFTDEQLNEVYNIADLFALPTSNEGFGLPIVEALSAGKIVLTTDYSTSKELADDSGAGFTIPHVKYVEYGTLFYKAHVTPSSIAKMIHKIYSLKPATRRAMELRAREYAVREHNYDKLAQQWEVEFDAIEPLQNVNWDVSVKPRRSNPHAEIPPCTTPVEWLVAMYKNILDTDIMAETNGQPEQSPGIQYWLSEISQNRRSQQEIEAFFRQTATEECKKQPIDIRELLDATDQKRLLFIMKESAGDNFLCTAIVSSLKEKYPEHAIYVASKPEFADIWRNNPNVKRWLGYSDAMVQYGWGIDRYEKGVFDIILTPAALTQFAPATWHNNGNTQSFLI